MRSKTDIPGMDRPIGEYVEHWRRRQALEGKRNRRQARHDAERIAAMLRKKFGATRIVLFGSLVAERFSANSDIDLAVDGLAPADYFLALVEAGKLPVDLKPLGELFPHVRNRVLATGEETMRAMSPKRLRGVADDSSTELERLQRLSEDIAFVPAEIARDPGHARLFYENLALTLHNFYTGCERIFSDGSRRTEWRAAGRCAERVEAWLRLASTVARAYERSLGRPSRRPVRRQH